MIGRLRAAWDEAGRLANHRRGTNPMTRDEWKSAELRQGEILAHVEVLAEMHPELLRAMHLLRDLLNGLGEVRDGESQMLDSLISRKCVRVHCECGRLLGVLAGAVVAHESSPPCGGADAHSVGDRLVTGVETAAPVTDATDSLSGVDHTARVTLAGHVIELTLEQNALFGTLKVTAYLPGEPIWRTLVHPSLRGRDSDSEKFLLADGLSVDESLSDQRKSFRTPSVRSMERSAGFVGRSTPTSSAATSDELVVGSLVVDKSEPGGLHRGTGGHTRPDSGERKDADKCVPQCDRNDDVSVSTRPNEDLMGVRNEDGLKFGWGWDGPVGQSASPSIDGGHRTVGEGEVAGVETAAPVTDATNEEIADLANLLEDFHERGESWLTMAKTARHIFRGSGPQTA